MPGPSCPLCQRDADIEILAQMGAWRVRCKTCGEFQIARSVVDDGVRNVQYLDDPPTRVRNLVYILSGLTRQASDSGNPIWIMQNNISQLLQSVAVPATPLENMDKALICISERQQKADDEPQVFYENDYPLAFAKDPDEFKFFLATLVERKLLHSRGDLSTARNNGFFRLTPEGWEKIEQLRKG